MNKADLIFITSGFPFGYGESFIEPELEHLRSTFGRIVIVSQNVSSPAVHDIPEDVKIYRYNTRTGIAEYFKLIWNLPKWLRDFSFLINKEREFRKKVNHRLPVKQMIFLSRKTIKAIQLRDFLENVVDEMRSEGPVVLYSYWLNTGAHAISLIKRKQVIRIARAHGSDLYEEKSPGQYLPLIKSTADALDGVFFISGNGKKYFETKTVEVNEKYMVSKLGINASVVSEPRVRDEYFRIVSCSNLVSLKRIDLIIRGIAIAAGRSRISWTHFGDGPLKDELVSLAGSLLSDNKSLKYNFSGQVPNSEIHNFFYRNHIDLFINTSITEGTPVSIMEAQAYGIPVIATDVGGVSEMIPEGAGILLPPDLTPALLASKIMEVMEMSHEQTSIMSHKAYENWKANYNASVNYPDFINKVNSILAARIASQNTGNET